MSDTKGTINIDKVKKCITRIISNSQDTPYIDHFSIYNDNVQVYIQGRIDFTALNEIKEEMQDKNMKVSPGDQDTIIISFNVNGCYYRDYELPVLDLKPLDAYKDNFLQVGNFKYEEVFKDGRYNYFYTYRDDKIKDYASQHYEHSIKDFYCLVKPDKPQNSKIYPPYIVCKGFIYYTDYKRYGEQSALGCHLEFLDSKIEKRYERYVSTWAPEIFNNIFPRCSKGMAPSMFDVEDNIDIIDIEKLLHDSLFAKNVKGVENLLYSSIMVFDTLGEAQDMCDKVNKYYDVYRLKNSRYY
jgi:phosphotransferase system IIB component